MQTLTYNFLCNAMANRTQVVIRKNGQTYIGLVNGIMPESGSGRDWLITLNHNGKNTTVYIRTY